MGFLEKRRERLRRAREQARGQHERRVERVLRAKAARDAVNGGQSTAAQKGLVARLVRQAAKKRSGKDN